jgi:hypothetical protein
MPKQLESENELRELYYLITETNRENHKLPFRPRWLNQFYAWLCGYFWLPCHICGQEYGGHEWIGSDDNTMTGICPSCSLKVYNDTGHWVIEKGQNINSLTPLTRIHTKVTITS